MVAVTIADETSLTNPGHHIFATSKITQGYDFHFNFYRSIAAVNSEDETSLQRPIQFVCHQQLFTLALAQKCSILRQQLDNM